MNALQQIPFGTPIKFGSRDGIYVEFILDQPHQHKLLINWGEHPYFTHQPIHAFTIALSSGEQLTHRTEQT